MKKEYNVGFKCYCTENEKIASVFSKIMSPDGLPADEYEKFCESYPDEWFDFEDVFIEENIWEAPNGNLVWEGALSERFSRSALKDLGYRVWNEVSLDDEDDD